MDRLQVTRYRLPLGNGGVRVLVASDGDTPKTVLMSYQGFLEVCGALFLAVEALKAAGFDPEALSDMQLAEMHPAISKAQGADGT